MLIYVEIAIYFLFSCIAAMAPPEEEFYQAQFPALSKCLLIDARWSSRQDLAKDIKASALFDTIIEAKYVDEGITLLRKEIIDACFFGPTVSKTTIIDFLKKSSSIVTAEDCAFISILRDDEESELQPLLDNGIHGAICQPYSKKAFADMVVRAVVSANKDGIWAGISLLLGDNKDEDQAARDEMLRFAASALRRATKGLNDIIALYRSKHYGLDEYGEPSTETLGALEKITEEILGALSSDEVPDGFRSHFRQSIKQWFVDVVETNPRMAQEKLRKHLFSFGKK